MKKKNVLILVVVVVTGLAVLYFYHCILYKEARDISTEEAAFTITAGELAADYGSDPQGSDSKYLNKPVEVRGKVTAVSGAVIILDSLVVCSFDSLQDTGRINKVIDIKGRCIGFDELFGEVKLDQCTIKNK